MKRLTIRLRLKQTRPLVVLSALLVVGALGLGMLQDSSAATVTLKAEAEQGTIASNAAVVSGEAGVSGVGAVKFGSGTSGAAPVALVYRGPASCCSEAVFNLLKKSSYNFDVKYIGPNETLKMVASSFVGATVYAQPGGNGTVDEGLAALGGNAAMTLIKNFVNNGGKYLGFCMGAYFAGSNPGMGLLSPGDTDGYIGSPGASVSTDADTIVPVTWRTTKKIHFFQDGAYILPSNVAGERILAKYDNGLVDALTKPYGKGRIGVVGSHPEADRTWYTDSLFAKDTDGLDATDGLDLINETMAP
jgi:glutamine amidotransferase-like uncharacterized protein